MSDDTQAQSIRKYNAPNLPYITFRRTRNPGLKDRFRPKKKGSEEMMKVADGEYVEDWHWRLADKHGYLFPSARVTEVTRKINKGWRVVGYGNFNMVFDRMDPKGELVKELHSIEGYVKQLLGQSIELEAAQAELAATKAKLAKAVGNQHFKEIEQDEQRGNSKTKGSENRKTEPGRPAQGTGQTGAAGSSAPAETG